MSSVERAEVCSRELLAREKSISPVARRRCPLIQCPYSPAAQSARTRRSLLHQVVAINPGSNWCIACAFSGAAARIAAGTTRRTLLRLDVAAVLLLQLHIIRPRREAKACVLKMDDYEAGSE